MYYLCSENKGADLLRGYREAVLRLLFSHMQKAGFLTTRLIYEAKKKSLINLRLCFSHIQKAACFKIRRYILITTVCTTKALMALISQFQKENEDKGLKCSSYFERSTLLDNCNYFPQKLTRRKQIMILNV